MTVRFQSFLLFACFAATSIAFGGANDVRLMPDNSLKIEGNKIALFGVSVPTATAKCLADEKKWPCGAAATLRLNELVQQSALSCESILELENISLARCSHDASDVARQLVKEGWALTVSPESDYSEAEAQAKNLQLGVWRGGFLPPQEWRQYPDTSLNPYLDLICSICAERKR